MLCVNVMNEYTKIQIWIKNVRHLKRVKVFQAFQIVGTRAT